jgi:hypothetical protein
MSQGQEHTGAGDQTPDGRAATFHAVEGATEHYSGEVLLVSAYAALWAILFFWLALVWRKQAALGERIAGLEHELDKAATSRDGKRQQ